eukprot:TRINITY_DN29970_c0_g1_i2.p1 TRINITY_DN29970_c0_g1~~TRINITY_DN29970_c0_g1_i2.p1  ORF type:complete len:330 (-),score=46.91 TRINITY_DN29970_c0_g1_i2:110-1099(-)
MSWWCSPYLSPASLSETANAAGTAVGPVPRLSGLEVLRAEDSDRLSHPPAPWAGSGDQLFGKAAFGDIDADDPGLPSAVAAASAVPQPSWLGPSHCLGFASIELPIGVGGTANEGCSRVNGRLAPAFPTPPGLKDSPSTRHPSSRTLSPSKLGSFPEVSSLHCADDARCDAVGILALSDPSRRCRSSSVRVASPKRDGGGRSLGCATKCWSKAGLPSLVPRQVAALEALLGRSMARAVLAAACPGHDEMQEVGEQDIHGEVGVNFAAASPSQAGSEVSTQVNNQADELAFEHIGTLRACRLEVMQQRRETIRNDLQRELSNLSSSPSVG